MNGPRLQASLFDGFENVGGASYLGCPLNQHTAYSTWDYYYNWYSGYSNIYLFDLYNGLQSISRYGYYGTNLNANEYNCKARFAIKSNEDPNVYLIFSYFWVNNTGVYIAEVYYYNITDQTASYYAPQRTFSVTYSLDEFWSMGMTETTYQPKNIARTSAGLFSGHHNNDEHFRHNLPYGGNANTYGNLSNPGTAYAQCVISGNNATSTYEFPANCNMIRMNGSGSNTTGMCFNFFPLNLNGRKYGGPNDKFPQTTSYFVGGIYKVYSPQKGCMALKTHLNGEIPIFKD